MDFLLNRFFGPSNRILFLLFSGDFLSRMFIFNIIKEIKEIYHFKYIYNSFRISVYYSQFLFIFKHFHFIIFFNLPSTKARTSSPAIANGIKANKTNRYFMILELFSVFTTRI